MNILGISALHHDASICLLDGDKILFASQSERFSRVKNDKMLNCEMFAELLRYDAPQKIVWYERPGLRAVRKIFFDKTFKGVALSVRNYVHKFIDADFTTIPE